MTTGVDCLLPQLSKPAVEPSGGLLEEFGQVGLPILNAVLLWAGRSQDRPELLLLLVRNDLLRAVVEQQEAVFRCRRVLLKRILSDGEDRLEDV